MMIVKVQGGGKVYANTGSCSDVVSYLQHEDAERLQAGLTPEPFFNQEQNRISPKEVTNKIDNNRKGLKAKEAKFYVITVAPSRAELRKNGSHERGTGSSHERVYPYRSHAEICRGV